MKAEWGDTDVDRAVREAPQLGGSPRAADAPAARDLYTARMHLLILGDPGVLADAITKRLTAAGDSAYAASPRTDSEAKALLTENGWTAVVDRKSVV